MPSAAGVARKWPFKWSQFAIFATQMWRWTTRLFQLLFHRPSNHTGYGIHICLHTSLRPYPCIRASDAGREMISRCNWRTAAYTHAPLKLNTRSAITGVTARHDTGRHLLDGDLATRLDQTDQPTAITGNADIRLRRRVGARRNFASSAPFDGDDRKSVRASTVMHWRTDCLRYIWLSATVNGVFTLYTRAISPVH